MNTKYFIVMMMSLLIACFVYAQDTSEAASDSRSDLAFDRYVSVDLIGQAVFAGDVDLLTDISLQLATAERTLVRFHMSGITSEALLLVTLNIAVEKRDKDGLERLAKVANSLNNKLLAGRVAAGQKLISESASITPDFMVSVKEVSPEDYAAIHRCLSAVQLAKVTNDATWLQDWETKYECKLDNNSKHYIYLKDLIAKTLADLPNNEGARIALIKLSDASRGDKEPDNRKPGDRKPGDRKPDDKHDDRNKPDDKHDDRNKPDDKHDDHNKPDDKPGDRNWSGEWNRPYDRNRPGQWNRPDDRPGEWNRPGQWNWPGEWNRHIEIRTTCTSCQGVGSKWLICTSCNGIGRIRRGWMSYQCSSCQGRGRTFARCTNCSGSGWIVR